MSPAPETILQGPPLEQPAAEVNVSARLRSWAREAPDRCAVRKDQGTSMTFAELEARCNRLARGLRRVGLTRGDRASLFVRPGPELIALTHALFRTGIVPVLIDPGMGRRNLLACVARIRPRALIGVPAVHLARKLFPRAFSSVEFAISVGPRLGLAQHTLDEIEAGEDDSFEIADTSRFEEAAILFTSGSTGPPKGVSYNHGNFEAQLKALEQLYRLEPGETDVACFPLFALFDNALGLTSIFPEMDATHPARCDPARIFRALESGATFTFGSPAIWRRVLPWMQRKRKRFSTLRRITIAGAPIAPELVLALRDRMPAGGEVHTPYGATEALPVSNISGAEIQGDVRARTEAGEGTCVGRLAPGIEVALLEIGEEPFDSWKPGMQPPPGEPGEICVRGHVVTREYKYEPAATALAKIGTEGDLWHRMGDIGYVDDEGRLWYLGRKSHRLQTKNGLLMPVPYENVFNRCEKVHRTALVGIGPSGREEPCLVVEAQRGANRRRLLEDIEDWKRHHAPQAPIERFLVHPSFPVDVRHNAKIHRLELKSWAEKRTR